MYISQLELQGFKSFANKTKISFDKGVTAIVGPNGCGKSNIVDALRWVMGEQRPTQLRSANMSNVIFNGTADKKALGMAEVSLTFVNNRGVLPTEYNEVTISRRLYRSGDSEYLINNTTCRLKDIMELFMDTGMGSDAYSVIELKIVDEILQDKHNDRRRLFEEAAGVTKYKEKRKKTFRKLDETQADLQRVKDYLVEINKQVKTLERQAKKAKKAKKYQKELKRLELALNKHEYRSISEDLKPLKSRIAQTEKDKTQIQQYIVELEQNEESVRKELTRKEQTLVEVQRKLGEIQNRIQTKQTRLKVLKERISNREESIQQHKKELEQSHSDLAELKDLLETTRQLKVTTTRNLEEASQNLTSSQNKYSKLQQQHTEVRKQQKKLQSDYQKLLDRIAKAENASVKLDSQIDSVKNNIYRIANEIESKATAIGELKAQKEPLTQKIEQQNEQITDAENRYGDANAELEELRNRENQLKDTIREINSKIDALESRIDLLEDISKSHETFPQAVQFLLDEYQNHDSFKVLSSILSTKESLAIALESVLGSAANYLITESLDEAIEAARFLEENEKGKATFIPLEALKASREPLANSLAHKTDCDLSYTPLKNILLGRVLIAGSLEDAYSLVDPYEDVSAVTSSGDVVSPQGFLNSGSVGKNVGLKVGLGDKIEKLIAKIDALDNKKENAEQRLITTQQQIKGINIVQLRNHLKKNEEARQDTGQKINNLTSKIELFENDISKHEKQKADQIEQKQHLEQKKEDLSPAQTEQKERVEEIKQKRNEAEKQLEEVEEQRAVAQNRYNDAKLSHQELSNKAETYQRDIKRAKSGIEQIKNRRKNRLEEVEKSQQQITVFKDEIATLEKELAAAHQERKEFSEKKAAVDKLCSQQRGKINKLEKNLKEYRNKKETTLELLHKLTMAQNELELKSKAIADHIWEQYEILMEQIEVTLPEDMQAEEVKKRTESLKQKLNRLGETNPLAIEEYENEKERLEFYQEQIDDLKEAEDKLLESIEEINKTAQERFQKVFEKIRSNFKKVFKTLFDKDDYCDLWVKEDDEDPLDSSIEIKANPKGKRPSNINQLSGGEKTLTAIALLFAIYLVKPSPFCVLDEVDAPLDDANIERFANMLKEFSDFTQFIIITHNKKTMAKSRMMYGVTMPDTGVSRLVGVRLEDVEDFELN